MPRQTPAPRPPSQPDRTEATQPYRATRAAQACARLTVIDNGRTVTLHPLADVLSEQTRATLAALRKAARRG